jgi:DNA repair protein RAD7
VEDLGKSPSANERGISTRGRRKYNREVKVEGVKEGVVEGLKENPCTDENGTSRRGRRYSREEKEKRSKEGAVVIEE